MLKSFLNFLDCREICTGWQLETKTIKDNKTCMGLYSRRCSNPLYEQIETEYNRTEIGKSNWIFQFDAELAHRMVTSIVLRCFPWNRDIASSKLILYPVSPWPQYPLEDLLLTRTRTWGNQFNGRKISLSL